MKFKAQLILSTSFYKLEGHLLYQTLSRNIDNTKYPNEIQGTANLFYKFYKLVGHLLGQTLSWNIDNTRYLKEIQGTANPFYKFLQIRRASIGPNSVGT